MLNFNLIFRILLTLNATSLLLIIFFIQKGYSISFILQKLSIQCPIPEVISYALYTCVPIALTGVSIFLTKFLGKDAFKANEVECLEHANNSFLPSYLGYFFVALSIGNITTLTFVYGILFIFTLLSQALYFNPLFLIFGYEFYNIKTKDGAVVFLISRKKYRKPEEIEIPEAYRINNYTYIERSKA
ncbi:MAG TPA: hypothetical protein DCP19_05870 [Pseudomonas sp.]|nr:hypothetical protein [Pseudomonas sp.]